MNNYVSFITDEDFERCVSKLYDSYVAAHQDIDEKKLYSNKLDVIKLTFDKIFGNLTDEELYSKLQDKNTLIMLFLNVLDRLIKVQYKRKSLNILSVMLKDLI